MLALLSTWPPFWLLIFAALLGAVVGSFLNVLILRLPQKLYAEHAAACNKTDPISNRWFGLDYLITPGSHCPQCQHQIRAWENIPVISWLLLRARCSSCQTSISVRYPLIELLTSLLSLAVVWHFGATTTALYACVLIWCLVALAMIDIDEQLLPDQLTLLLLWLGLLANLSGTFTSLDNAVIGAAIGYSSLWLVFQVFRLLANKEGMGYGDFKLFAALGAWFGWSLLPQILFISSLVGAIVGISLMLLRKHDRQVPLPFGPYLVIAGIIALFWGHEINQFYLNYTGIE